MSFPKRERWSSLLLDRVLLAALLTTLLFLASGALQLAFSISFTKELNNTATSPKDGAEATRHLLYQRLPLLASIANAGAMLVTFGITIPGLLFPSQKSLLKIGAQAVALCGLFTLSLGLYIWIGTLCMGESFAPVYIEQEADVQSLMQTSFQCCGYYNSTSPAFIPDNTCPTPAAAALRRGCMTFISNYANRYINIIFTTLFGMVGIDVLLILAILCLLQTRKERERYRLIEEKTGHF